MLKLAFIGTNEGNGHIFSWSAIINGNYDKELMKQCGYPVIVEYLSRQSPENLGIPDAKVTHVWTKDKETTSLVAKTCYIENVIDSPEQAIGHIDAAVITTDIASTHLELAKPFVENNIPVFIDKPLADSEEDLRIFYHWHKAGKKIMSCSSLRYAKEIEALDLANEKIYFISGIMAKSWERYGVHAVEGLYAITGGKIKSILNIGDEKLNLVYLEFYSDLKALLQVVYDSRIFGRFDIFCRERTITIETTDYFHMFKRQLEDVINFFKTGKMPFPFSETLEITKIVISGIKSKQQKIKILLEEISLED